ncbi:helix-turn-helix domain-containing protein [Anaerotignum faecicola]
MKRGEDMLQRLKDFREDKDISQKKMAEILNVAQTTYSDYELGKINIPLNTLKKLALFFDTSIDYLLELTDVSKPYPRKK